MTDAFICDAIRTPFGRYGGALSAVRPDDLAAVVLRELMRRNPGVDPGAVDDVIFGCANQAGEDNRNVARMSALLAGLPVDVPGATLNRLCGSGLDAVASAARAIAAGEARRDARRRRREHEPRAVRACRRARAPFARDVQIYDTTIGWRFVNPLLKQTYGVDSMPETGENVAAGVRRRARGPGRVRAAQPAARARRAGGGLLRRRRSSGRGSRKARRATLVTRGRAPARDEPRGAREATDAVSRRRHRHGRQCIRRQRRRLRLAARLARARSSASASCRGRASWGTAVAGVAPRIMGIGPVAGDAQGARAARHDARRHRSHRAQRGVCRAGARRAARARHCRRCGARESAGRRHRARASAGRERCAPRDDGACTSSSAAAAAAPCARCASASARASPW